jgi:hypothetical protein
VLPLQFRLGWSIARGLQASALAIVSLSFPGRTGAAELATAESAPSSEAVARLCVAHGRYCNCPGCRAYYEACGIPCPTPLDAAPQGESMDGEAVAPQAEGEAAVGEAEPMSGPMPSVSSNLGAIAASASATPGMIGDFFGGGYQYLIDSPVNGAAVSVAGGDRILKFADNNSPLPQDRLFFNYHLFTNPVLDVRGQAQDVNRFTFGLEKTAWDGTASVEFRVPFQASVDSTQRLGQVDTTGAEFGNLALAVKMLLYQGNCLSVAGGLGILFPTADDSAILNTNGDAAVVFSNESYFLQPFLGFFMRPTPALFTQFVTQVNFDVSGSVLTLNDPSFFGDTGSDRIFEQPLLFLDYSVGYWLYRTKRCDAWLTGVAPMVELHYTTTMDDLDQPQIGEAQVFEDDSRRDALNLTGGVLFGLGDLTSLRIAGVAPLRDQALMYDAEFGVQLIRRY